jgi:alpha-glucosidase
LEGKYKDWARDSIRERYRYLRHLYTCLYEVNQNGGSCIDPLFYHFPTDDNVYSNYSKTFIYGNSIKVTPVLEEMGMDATVFKSYFPKGDWVSLTDYSIIHSNGEMVELSANQSKVHSHMMPGSVIGIQENEIEEGVFVNTTADLMSRPISILVNRDENG